MSEYLGFQPTSRPGYFFLSYNSEDKERVGELAGMLEKSSVPIWYDYGIPYNEKWEAEISSRIKASAGMILFFTRGILQKENSYVQKEYRLAKFHRTEITVVLLDQIRDEEVPAEKAPFWLDLTERQCVHGYSEPDQIKLCETVSKAIGMSTHQDRMNQLIVRYRELFDAEQYEEAERYLNDYMHGLSLAGRARIIASLDAECLTGAQKTQCLVQHVKEPPPRLNNDKGKPFSFHNYYQCMLVTLKDTVFTVGNDWVIDRGYRGDIHVLHIWRGAEHLSFTSGVELELRGAYYDSADDILYITYREQFVRESDRHVCNGVNVIAVEHPLQTPVCSVFRLLLTDPADT